MLQVILSTITYSYNYVRLHDYAFLEDFMICECK